MGNFNLLGIGEQINYLLSCYYADIQTQILKKKKHDMVATQNIYLFRN